LHVLWFALLTSNALYLGVLLMLRTRDRRGAPGRARVHADHGRHDGRAQLGGGQRAAAADVATRDAVKDEPSGAPEGFRRPAETERVFDDPGAAAEAAVATYRAPFILGMSLAESVSLCGFVLGYLGAGAGVFLPFFALGAGLQASRFPTMSAIVGAFEAARGARLAGGA
jgi:hypothetical protein